MEPYCSISNYVQPAMRDVYKFDELSDQAKEYARSRSRYLNQCDDWWVYVYEDAKRMGSLLGIEIGNIYFSGFWSQGDGAAFTGDYTFAPTAYENIVNEAPFNKDLQELAAKLTVLQMTRRLAGAEYLSAKITLLNRGVNPGRMLIEVSQTADDVTLKQNENLARLLRDFADWIYQQLENEFDYLNADEQIDEMLRDDSFDEDGHTI